MSTVTVWEKLNGYGSDEAVEREFDIDDLEAIETAADYCAWANAVTKQKIYFPYNPDAE